MNKKNNNNNHYKEFWKRIGTGFISIVLSISFFGGMATAVANSWRQYFEKKGFTFDNKNLSISTTEAPIPTTEIYIENILQETIPTLEENKTVIITQKNTTFVTEPTIPTIPTTESTEPITETTEPTIPTVTTTEPTAPIIESTISNIESPIENTIPNSDNNHELDIEKYIKEINNIEVNYKHHKYYPTKIATFKIYATATTTVTKCDYEFNGDIEKVINKLFENSQRYINKNPNFITPFKDENNQNIELKTQQIWFELNLYQILNDWMNNINDINEDFCTLENYSIVYSFDENDHQNLLAYTTNDTLVIFPKRIQVHSSITNEAWENVLYDVMNRQLNTIRQKSCNCRKDRGQTYNQISTKTLIDAATESETKFYDNATAYNRYYQDEKESEELLLTLGLFRDDVTYNDYYNAIYNSNLESLHAFFNAYTEEEINKLYTILYAIDAVNLKNDLLLTYYNENDLVSFNEITTFVGHSYKIDIFKNVLKNMIQYTNTHKDFTLKDNLTMYKYIEGLIVQSSYEISNIDHESNTTTINFESDFTENIYILRNIYYEFLCNNYKVSFEELKELETTDINSIIFYINYYCQEKYSLIPERYYYIIDDIVNRFPLLKEICNATYYSSCGVERFETETKAK